MMTTVVVHPDAAAVADAAAARLLIAIQDTLAERDEAHIVLTGGTLGIATLAAAANSPLVPLLNWTSVHLWWGDERFVHAGDTDRNEGQAQNALISSLKIPEENIHRMGAADEFESADAAAAAYGAELAEFGDPTPSFDVLMLGLGPDAHVASLFPRHPSLDAPGVAAAVHSSPKPPPTRVTLTRETINRAREVWILAAGPGKAEAVRQSMAQEPGIPGGLVRGTERTLWLVDAAAAASL